MAQKHEDKRKHFTTLDDISLTQLGLDWELGKEWGLRTGMRNDRDGLDGGGRETKTGWRKRV